MTKSYNVNAVNVAKRMPQYIAGAAAAGGAFAMGTALGRNFLTISSNLLQIF